MSAVDHVDHTFNTTSISPTGIYLPTPDQFFCQMTKKDVRCVSSAQFAAQPFHQLCPSGDCWTDCRDLERLYAPLPGGIAIANQTAYGTPPNITLWPLCAGLANITQALQDEIPPKVEADRFRSFFTNSTQENLRAVAAASTQCWTDTCAKARHPDKCADPCAAANLLEKRTVTQLAGTRECIRSLCLNITGLPFGNQDIVGIGVTSSYVIQSSIIILCWVALAVGSFLAWRNRHRLQKPQTSKFRESLLQSITAFHAAQCYFSIPLAVAAFFSDPFTLDPLNAFGLLPVSINGFLPQIFTFAIMNNHDLESWYPLFLTSVSYLLNTVVFWAVIKYLNGIKGHGTALKAPAYKSLGGIQSCGGLTGIGVCLSFQDDSPPAFLIQRYGEAAWTGIKLAPWLWAWCTIALLVLAYSQFRLSWSGKRRGGNRSHKVLGIPHIASVPEWMLQVLRSCPVYWVISAIFFVGLVYQAVMFYSFIGLGLVDLHTWTFGQIVAVAVWVPPVVDYVHLQTDLTLGKTKTPRPRADSSQDLQPLSRDDGSNSYRLSQGYAHAAERDDDDTESITETATQPNEFPPQPRRAGGPGGVIQQSFNDVEVDESASSNNQYTFPGDEVGQIDINDEDAKSKYPSA